MKEKDLAKLIRPNNNYVLVEIILEGDKYESGISRLNKACEPYSKVLSVGDSFSSEVLVGNTGTEPFLKPGDYIITRPNLSFNTFELEGKLVSFIQKHEIVSRIDESLIDQFKGDKQKEITKPKPQIDLVN